MPHVSAADVCVTHGATQGLNLACQALLDPGDVCLILSPHWPLINSMVHTASAVPIEVPFFSEIRRPGAPSPYEILRRHLHQRTRAVYLTSPNNPDGVVLNREELASVARFCKDHNLYIISDEAYDRFLYGSGKLLPCLASFDGMADKVISVFTFSKSHRMAGLRVGYVVAPPDIRDAITKLANVSTYNISLIMQVCACMPRCTVRRPACSLGAAMI